MRLFVSSARETLTAPGKVLAEKIRGGDAQRSGNRRGTKRTQSEVAEQKIRLVGRRVHSGSIERCNAAYRGAFSFVCLHSLAIGIDYVIQLLQPSFSAFGRLLAPYFHKYLAKIL